MNQVISVTPKNVYGETKIYPANEQAQALADIAGTKTLTHRTLRIAKEMGFEIVQVTPDLTEVLGGLLSDAGLTKEWN